MNEQELAELDFAVAKAEKKLGAFICEHPNTWICMTAKGGAYEPTRDGAEAMRLLEKYRLIVAPVEAGEGWRAAWEPLRPGVHAPFGETPAIAICRAVVALKQPAGSGGREVA